MPGITTSLETLWPTKPSLRTQDKQQTWETTHHISTTQPYHRGTALYHTGQRLPWAKRCAGSQSTDSLPHQGASSLERGGRHLTCQLQKALGWQSPSRALSDTKRVLGSPQEELGFQVEGRAWVKPGAWQVGGWGRGCGDCWGPSKLKCSYPFTNILAPLGKRISMDSTGELWTRLSESTKSLLTCPLPLQTPAARPPAAWRPQVS